MCALSSLKSNARYRGELATDLTTPVARLPDDGEVVSGMYATIEKPGSVEVATASD